MCAGISRWLIICFVFAYYLFQSAVVLANPNKPPPFSWGRDNVELVFAADGRAIANNVDGRQCVETANVKGSRCLYFDIDNGYVFDSDVEAAIEIEYDSQVSGPIHIEYDSNYLKERHAGAFHLQKQVARADKSLRWARYTFKLPRARFYNRQQRIADFRLYSPDGMLRLSDIKITLDEGPAGRGQKGTLKLRIIDDTTGEVTPARVGIYDEKQRFKPPASESNAVPINYFYRTINMYNCRNDTTWPIKNTYSFWIYGRYECALPAGRYRLIVRKGIEYYLVNEWLSIEAGKTLEHTVKLKRWADMSKKGWYSGDCHVHIGRTPEQDPAILAQCEGEDLNVSNLAQVGDIEATSFLQYAFGEKGKYRKGKYVLVPAEEDPRTPHRGHSLLLNIKKMIRDDETYYLYHKAYQEAHRQGGLVGYAHVGYAQGSRAFFVERGMALDMPFGIIDFAELLQANRIDHRVFYEFLNLGYKLVPTAGSDFPYIDPPGLVRNYVHIDGAYSDQAWFDGLKKGRTFVTSGPMLDFTVNGTSMGGELRIGAGEKLVINASARINPIIGTLKELQFIVQGEPVLTRRCTEGKKDIIFTHTMSADYSMWMAIKVVCEGKLLAHTAPIYVIVDGRRHWKRSAVAELVARQRQRLKDLVVDVPSQPVYEKWVTDTLKAKWAEQKEFIARRAELANAQYDQLLEDFKKSQ